MKKAALRDYANAKELEADIAYVGYLMLRYGEWLEPILDRLERELEEMRRARSPLDRARAAIERHARPAEALKAIR